MWKLSTERLILLEEENKCLREKAASDKQSLSSLQQQTHNKSSSTSSRRYSTDNNNLLDDGDADEEDAEDSDIELEKCLYGGGRTKSNGHRRLVEQGTNGKLISGSAVQQHQQQGRNNLVNSSSASSLASSVSVSTGLNLCDSLKLRSSRSCWQLGAVANGQLDENQLDKNGSRDDNLKTPTNYCEKCEILDAELNEMRQKYVELELALDDCNEKNFVLDKLNRSIEIENENFAYKVSITFWTHWAHFKIATGCRIDSFHCLIVMLSIV